MNNETVNRILLTLKSTGANPVVPYSMIVGEVIKELRSQKGLTQNKICQIAGITQSAYSRIENGDINPSIAQIRDIALALEANVSDIICATDIICSELRQSDLKICGAESENDIRLFGKGGALAAAPTLALGALIGGPIAGIVAGFVAAPMIDILKKGKVDKNKKKKIS